MAEDKGREGSLPQSEVAKALVFRQVLEAIEKHTKKTCWELTGMSKKDFTASQLTKKGGKKGGTVTGRVGGSMPSQCEKYKWVQQRQKEEPRSPTNSFSEGCSR